VLTGVIYGAIVIAWAAYLVPLALRRHDEASRSRSIERFSSAMRILARRQTSTAAAPRTKGTADGRVVVTPKRSARVLPPDAGPEPERVLVTPPRNRVAERMAAARRRRVLSLLLLLSVAVGAAVLVGLAPTGAAAVPPVLVLGFLVVARRAVRRAAKPYWVDVPAPEQSSAVVVRRTPVRVEASLGTPAKAGPDTDDEPTIALTVAQVATMSARTADGGSLWDPLPVTLPTYVGAPAATRTFRTISLGEPGTWTSGHSAEDSRSVAMEARAAARSAQPISSEERGGDSEATEEIPRVVNG
jgi:hypothetical protein